MQVQAIRDFLWKWRGLWITPPIATALVVGLRFAGALQLLEWVTLDQYFRVRPVEPADSRIVLVAINEQDIEKYGWPLSDGLLADVLQKVKAQNPRAIGLDLYRDRPVKDGHAKLEAVFRDTPNLIGIAKVAASQHGGTIAPPPALAENGQFGASDLVVDADGSIRRNLLSLDDAAGNTVMALSAQLALIYLGAEGIEPTVEDAENSVIRFGAARIVPLQTNDGGYVRVDAGGYQILSDFRRLQTSFTQVSMDDVLTGTLTPNVFDEKIVLIGTAAEGLGDYYYTSYSYDLNTRSPGVAIHGAIASQLLSYGLDGRQPFRFWPEPGEWLWILLWATIGARLGWTLKPPRWTAITTTLMGVVLIGSTFVLFLQSWWVPIVPALMALIGTAIANKGYILWENLMASFRALEEYSHTLEQKVEARTLELSQKNVQLQAEQEKSERLLLNILPQPIAEELKHKQSTIATRFDNVTVLFSDLVNFTQISSQLTATEVVNLLNEIFSRFDQLADRHGLEKIKTIGDAYMIVGGVPEARPDHAEAIADMALDMLAAIAEFRERQETHFQLRIGINTGPVVAGVIGIRKFSYDLWGDTVNVASRMESHGKVGAIQVTEATYNLLKDKYVLEKRGTVAVKGKGEMVTYFLLGRRPTTPTPTPTSQAAD